MLPVAIGNQGSLPLGFTMHGWYFLVTYSGKTGASLAYDTNTASASAVGG